MMAPTFTRTDVLRIERAAAHAWPPARSEDIDGWTWRGSGGGTRRANSVLPLSFHGASPDAAIDRVEALYRAQGTRSCFQVVSIAEPADLDRRLADRGYTLEEPCLLLARRTNPIAMPAGVRAVDEPAADWMSVYTGVISPDRARDAPRLLAQVPRPRRFFTAVDGGEAIATALAVLSPDGVAVVECVATRADRRRSGGGRRVMDALEAWARSAGAGICALQVVESNWPARGLYEGRGYARIGGYHYRWRDVG